MNILITGGFGFIGSCLIRTLIKNSQNTILNIDCKTYSSMPESLSKIKSKRYKYKNINIKNFDLLNKTILNFKPNIIFHLAAESHVDNSIKSPFPFIESNIIGTFNLLESARNLLKNNNIANFKFIHVSTDEVYGSIDKKSKKIFTENSKFLPNSPYAASKASSDLLVRSWYKTFKLPVIITNCSNNFGQWQFPEKFIPVIISSCLNNKKIPIYGMGKNIREWIFVEDHVDYLIKISKKGLIGETYNIGSGFEFSNLEIVKKICNYFDLKYSNDRSYLELISFVSDRPGHDFKYSINSNKLKKLFPQKLKDSFDKNFYDTIDWYIDNKKWLFSKLKKINK